VGGFYSVEEINTTAYPITWANTYTKGNNGFPYTDGYFSYDVNTLITNKMCHSSERVWLASRIARISSNATSFGAHIMAIDDVGAIYNDLLRESSEGTLISYTFGRHVRPVVLLKSGLEIQGEGTEGNPWKIN